MRFSIPYPRVRTAASGTSTASALQPCGPAVAHLAVSRSNVPGAFVISAHQMPAQSFPPMSNDPTLRPTLSAYW